MDDTVYRRLVLKMLCERRCGNEPKGCPSGFCTESLAVDCLPSAQSEITDGQAIEHLQDSGWMQNHDKQMYEMGLRENLSDDGDSYDALLPSAQTNLDEWCTDCKEYDQERHCCPRWNRVIRETAEEVRKNAEPRWIPVTERLPEEGQRVLVTDEDGEIDIAHTIDYSDIGEGIEWWAHDYKCNPTAWRECPKPYGRREDEQQP